MPFGTRAQRISKSSWITRLSISGSRFATTAGESNRRYCNLGDGHWGLPGMRERAEKIRARLKVWSRSAGGTEVELKVPGHVAFESQPPNRPRWLTRLYAKKTATAETERAVARNPRARESK